MWCSCATGPEVRSASWLRAAARLFYMDVPKTTAASRPGPTICAGTGDGSSAPRQAREAAAAHGLRSRPWNRRSQEEPVPDSVSAPRATCKTRCGIEETRGATRTTSCATSWPTNGTSSTTSSTGNRSTTPSCMTDGRRFPALSKFQSLHGIVPMSWIQVLLNAESVELPELVRNLPRVIRIDQVKLVPDDKQLTATRTLLAWTSRPSRKPMKARATLSEALAAQSHVINIGVRETKVLGTADTEGGGDTAENAARSWCWATPHCPTSAASGRPRRAELLCYCVCILPRADVVVDYNGASFDWPYILIRLQLFLFFRRQRWRARKRYCGCGSCGLTTCRSPSASWIRARAATWTQREGPDVPPRLRAAGQGPPTGLCCQEFVESGDRLPAPDPEDLLLPLRPGRDAAGRGVFRPGPCPPDVGPGGALRLGSPSYKCSRPPVRRTDCRSRPWP